MHTLSRALLTPLLLAALSDVALSNETRPEQPVHYCNVPRLPLTEALFEFFDQVNGSYGFIPDSPEQEQIMVGPVTGCATVEEGLRQLLPPGFSFERLERSISIITPTELAPPAVPAITTTRPAMPEGSASGELPSREHGFIQHMLVRESRLGSEDLATPAAIEFDRRDIEALGVSTVAEVLDYLPQQAFSHSDGFRLTGEQYADLRGLGPGNTLILINGRRVGASATSFDANAFDLNTIPLAAVERIEVTTDAMPSAAGADGFGGAINFVMKEHFSRPLVEVRYGSADGGAEELRVSAAGERATEQLHASAVIDYFERQDLPGVERDLWRNQDYRRFGSADVRSPDSSPGNITSLTTQNLPGLSSRYAAVPGAVSSPPALEDFLSTAGARNLESLYQYRSIVPATERVSVVGSATFGFSDSSTAFGELLYTDRISTLRDLPVTLSSVLVPVTNAFNPFDAPVLSNVRLSGLGEHLQTTDAEFARAVLGLRHRAARWSGEIAATYVEDTARHTTRNDVDPAEVAAALAQSDPSIALNVFVPGPGASEEVLTSLRADPVVRDYSSSETQVSALLRSEALRLPAGDVSVLLGAQAREAQIEVAALAQGDARRSIVSSFAELRVPLLGREGKAMAVEELALTLATRLDRYSDIGSTWNSHAALVWQPLEDLMLRAAYGTNSRAPSLFELYQPTLSFPFALADPRRRNEVASVVVSVGGNPDLKETKGESWSLGLTFKPRTQADVQLALNAWQIEMQSRVASITLPAVFSHEDLFAGRITRDAPSAADLAAGLPGRLTALDLTPANVGKLSARGFDGSVSLARDSFAGHFSSTLSATWMDRFTTVDLPGAGPTQRVGVANGLGTIPRWRAVVRFGWERGPASAFTAVRFLGSYEDVNLLQNQLNGRDIQAQALVDLQASLDLDSASAQLRGVRLTVGVNNLFDHTPPFAEIGANFGYDVSQGDLRGRFGYVRITKRF